MLITAQFGINRACKTAARFKVAGHQHSPFH